MRSRWAALQLLCRNEDFIRQLDSILETPLLENPAVAAAFSSVEQQFNQEQKTPALLLDEFWLTITGANYPSALSEGLFWVQDRLSDLFCLLHAPKWLHGTVWCLGVYRVLAWVVSVMLPPMAIFFPLFTLLEDAGYLPHIAYNLDKTVQAVLCLR